MAEWQRTLKLQKVWRRAQKREITPKSVAAIVATRLEALESFSEFSIEKERLRLVSEFRRFAKCKDKSFEDFDVLLGQLYDWGDQSVGPWNEKVCWIATSF